MDEKTVRHIAKLANLKLTNDEVKVLGPQLTKIIDLIEHLNSVKTDKIEPTYQVTGKNNCWREDVVDKTRILDLRGAVIKVPKII